MCRINTIRLFLSTIVSTILLQRIRFWAVISLEAVVKILRDLHRFWIEEDAQDLVEYTMILCTLILFCLSFLNMLAPGIKSIWNGTDVVLNSAANVASS